MAVCRCFFLINFKCIILLVLIIPDVAGQVSADNVSIPELNKWYDSVVGIENTALINGPEYVLISPSTYTHPFFEQRSAWQGAVVINSLNYEGLRLMYDIYSDLLVLEHRYAGQAPIWTVLEKSRIEHFTLASRSFTRHNVNGEELYLELIASANGKMLFAQRRKVRVTKSNRFELEPSPLFHLKVDNRFHSFYSLKKFYELYPEIQTPIKDYVRSNDVSLGNDQDIIELFKYCEAQTISDI